MAIRLPGMILAKQILRKSFPKGTKRVPKGQLVVYVGETQKKRYVIPLSYLDHPMFQDLLKQAEEEYGFDHPMGGLTIPCNQSEFVDLLTSCCLMCL